MRSIYNFYSHLGKAIARLDKLFRVPSIDIDDLELKTKSLRKNKCTKANTEADSIETQAL